MGGAGAGEHVVGIAQSVEAVLGPERVVVVEPGQSGDGEVDVDRLGEVLHGPIGEFVRVLLEAVGGVEDYGANHGSHGGGAGR